MSKKKFRILKEIYQLLIAPHCEVSMEIRTKREMVMMEILEMFKEEIK